MSEKVTIEIGEADMAELREWARNSEISLETLLQEAVARYMERTRQWIEDIREADESPSYTLEEVKAYLAERRRQYRGEAAE
jgi:hypothetical protein